MYKRQGWLYQRPEDKNLNPERDLFDRTDPKAASIYLPYAEAELNEEGEPVDGIHAVKLGDTYYNYDDNRRSFSHVDAGLEMCIRDSSAPSRGKGNGSKEFISPSLDRLKA